MSERPLDILSNLDKELYDHVEKSRAMALHQDGALSVKIKLLIAIALDAARGSVPGVLSLVKQAMDQGATINEIMEVTRITELIYGVGSVYTVAIALKEMGITT